MDGAAASDLVLDGPLVPSIKSNNWTLMGFPRRIDLRVESKLDVPYTHGHNKALIGVEQQACDKVRS